jgi:SAM-dependent methyltransferase
MSIDTGHTVSPKPSSAVAGAGAGVARCPVCGSTDCEDFGPPVYRLPARVAGVPIELSDLPLRHLRCRRCTYRFIHPPIPAERLLACYSAAPEGNWHTGSNVAEDRAYDRKRDLLEKFAPGRRVLDFGCYDGGFLQYLGASWEPFGIEPSDHAAHIAASHGVRMLGPTVEAALESALPQGAAAPEPTVDAIVIFDVMEHLNDPVDTLAKLARFLRPGGIMLIETGDTDSRHFARVGKLYSYCGFVEHVGFFNRRSIAQAGASAAGLELAHFETSLHAKYWTRDPLRARMHVWAYWVLRGLHRLGMPLGRRLGRVAAGTVPRTLEPRDHFLAVLRKLAGESRPARTDPRT